MGECTTLESVGVTVIFTKERQNTSSLFFWGTRKWWHYQTNTNIHPGLFHFLECCENTFSPFILYIYNLIRKPFQRRSELTCLSSQHLGYWHQSKLKFFKRRTGILPTHVKNNNNKGKQYNILILTGKDKYKVYIRIYK